MPVTDPLTESFEGMIFRPVSCSWTMDVQCTMSGGASWSGYASNLCHSAPQVAGTVHTLQMRNNTKEDVKWVVLLEASKPA